MFVLFSGHALNRQHLGRPEYRLGRTDTKAGAAEAWILGSSPSKTKEGQALECDSPEVDIAFGRQVFIEGLFDGPPARFGNPLSILSIPDVL